MNKLIAALIAGLFAVSLNAFAADAASDAGVTKEKPAAAPAKKAMHKKAMHKKAGMKKEEKKMDAPAGK